MLQMKKTINNLPYYNLYINGQWIESNTKNFIAVENPANEEIFAYVTNANSTDVQYALKSAEEAQKSWQRLSPIKRAKYLETLAEKLEEKKDYFAELIVREQGKIYKEALGEVNDTIEYIMYAKEAASRIRGDILPAPEENCELMIKKVPYGVAVCLCAWNYPLALVGRKLGPALVTGNTVVIKPHELTPVATVELFKLIHEVGFPEGVVNLITGNGPDVGNQLVTSPITRIVSITGSVRAGQMIYQAAAPNVAGLILELGGKAPFIVLEDADINKAVEAAVISRYSNCGQICVCCDMIFVQESIAEKFTQKLVERVSKIKVGDPLSEEIEMGPKVSKADLDKIHHIVQETVSQGAHIAIGGKPLKGGIYEKGFWYEPTVLTNVSKDMCAAVDEIFGPVLPVIIISNLDEAIQIANASPYGLAAYLFTKDYSKFVHVSNVLEVGTIFYNQGITGYRNGFHSGHKLSGLSGEDGEYGIEAYLLKRSLYIRHGN